MRVDLAITPTECAGMPLAGRTAIVFDVLRATSTLATTLGNGADRVLVVGSIDDARRAAAGIPGALLAGERRCLKPEGFDLGNSPREHTAERVRGRTLVLSTTNGTRALLAAAAAPTVLAGSLLNAGATAARAAALARDVVLVCAGTEGRVAIEDLIGAGAVLSRLEALTAIDVADDGPRLALRLFAAASAGLSAALRSTQGGRNLIAAGLEEDVPACARVDALQAAVVVRGGPPQAVLLAD